MKKLLVLFALVGLFFAGCQDQISGPVESNNSQTSLSKGLDISLPLSSAAEYSVTQTIDGEKGGNITFLHSRIGLSGIETVYINLSFKKKAFEGSKDITVTVNFDDATISFTPHIEKFGKNNSVTLDASYTGINLNRLNLDSKRIDFYFFGDDGSKELIRNNGIKYSKKDNSVSVKNANLDHFSRYGWST